jgi:hypothetical protein
VSNAVTMAVRAVRERLTERLADAGAGIADSGSKDS